MFQALTSLACRLTNEAETRSELRNNELTIPRLHVHHEAAAGSKTAMSLPSRHNREVRYLVAIYLFAMIVFGFLNSVMSVIFVIEAVVSDKGYQVPVPIPIGIDIPETFVDPCPNSWSSPGCTYDLALTTLSSLLSTYTPFTIAGVTFEPPNGTLGMPYGARKHFANEVASATADEERRQYCLPVLEPHIISCTEVPFNQSLYQTENNFVRYNAMSNSVTQYGNRETGAGAQNVSITDVGAYQIVVDYPSTDTVNIKYRTNDQGQGTFMVYTWPVSPNMFAIISASNNLRDEGYATLLHQLMYDGALPDTSSVPEGKPYLFAAKCELATLQTANNNLASWRQVDFTLQNGILRANVTDERCPNPRGPAIGAGSFGFEDPTGFGDLQFALDGAAAIMSSTDGYSKLFNQNPQHGAGSDIFWNMSRLDSIVNKVYHVIQTSWTQSLYADAVQDERVHNKPLMMIKYPHLYIIRISWTPTTYIGLVLSILITLSAWILFFRWVRATYRFGPDAETWNLLRPVDLMAYALAAYQDLMHDLNTVEHRQAAMNGKTRTILHDRPVQEGTQSLIHLVNSNGYPSRVSTFVNTPVSPTSGKFFPIPIVSSAPDSIASASQSRNASAASSPVSPTSAKAFPTTNVASIPESRASDTHPGDANGQSGPSAASPITR